MNTKVVPNPEQKGWEEDGTTPNGTPIYKWESGGGSGGSSLWEQNGNDISYDKGNVSVSGSFTAGGPVIAQSQMVVSAAAVYRAKADISNGGNGLYFNGNAVLPADATGVSDTEGRFTLGTSQRQWKHVHGIDATFSGTVSGGGSEGQTLGSGRLRLNRATTNYITAESPTADINFQIGGVETDKNVLRIQANGNATFSGSVNAEKEIYTDYYLKTNSWRSKDQTVGLFMGASSIYPTNYAAGPGGSSSGEISLGTSASKFKDGYFTGSVTAGQVQLETGTYLNGNGAVIKNSTGSAGFIITNNGEQFDPIVDDQINVGDAFRRWKNARFSGKVTANTFDGTVVRSSHVIQDGSPVIDAKGLISTLSTLRNATKDETTLEGLRDSIGNAIGGLIEKYEAEIAETMKTDE